MFPFTLKGMIYRTKPIWWTLSTMYFLHKTSRCYSWQLIAGSSFHSTATIFSAGRSWYKWVQLQWLLRPFTAKTSAKLCLFMSGEVLGLWNQIFQINYLKMNEGKNSYNKRRWSRKEEKLILINNPQANQITTEHRNTLKHLNSLELIDGEILYSPEIRKYFWVHVFLVLCPNLSEKRRGFYYALWSHS